MTDYYRILGVERGADSDAIKRAYRRMASQHHPDKGGDKQRFQDIQKAYEILSDPQRRAQHDNPQPDFGGFSAPGFDFQTIFDMFGTRFQQGGHPHHQFRQQARMSLWVTLEDIARGGHRTVSVGTQQGTHAIEIEVPQGLEDGDTIQYSAIGPGGSDLVITFRIHPNPRFQRQGLHLIKEVTVSIWDLILGTTITVTDILNNQLELIIPKNTQPSTTMRLKARGLTRRGHGTGDLMIRIATEIPQDIDSDLLDLIEQKYRKSSA
jgi:DnaJ-class molecular chaperone